MVLINLAVLFLSRSLSPSLPPRLDFEYLKDLPVLVLDVNDDFKQDRIKQQEVLDKVSLVLLVLAHVQA